MRRIATGVCLMMAFMPSFRAAAVQYAFQVRFTDKHNSPYSISSPAGYLSSRSIARRAAQGIAIDTSDLPVNPAYIDSVLTLTGGEMHEVSKWLNLCVILLTDSSNIHALDGKAFVAGTKLIAYYPTFLHKSGLPGTASAHSTSVARKTTSGDSDYYGAAWDQTHIVNGNYLYDQGYQGAGKLIAVLDAGFLNTDIHPGFDSLRNSGRILDVHNFTLASGNIYSYDTHGTEVLSTMAGYIPDTYVGSAPLADYALYITEDDNSEQPIELVNMLAGAERADSLGADVITTSLGYNTFDNGAYNFNFATDFDGKSTTAAHAANMATQKGILFVATAGNEGGDSWNMILTPGDADSALTIGSVDVSGTPWITSGYGPNAAGQVKPDVCGLGHYAIVFTGTSTGPLDGTSLSTPQIAGWAASLWGSKPTATPFEIRQLIIRCASSYSSPGTHLGYGVPNFECAELNVPDVNPTGQQEDWVSVMPNPFGDQLLISATTDASGSASFTITDMTGKTVTYWQQFLFKGYNAPFSLNMSGIPAGIYILRVVTPTQQQVIKLQKH